MKSTKTIAAVAVFLMLSPFNLFADCPAISDHACCGGYTWRQYNFDLACATTTSNVTTTMMWCGEPSHRVAYPTTSTETVTYQYTIPTTSTGWEMRLAYNFDPGGNSANFERADYTLSRNGSQVQSGNIFYTNGQSSCQVAGPYGFSFNAGDILVITITMKTANSGSFAEVSNLNLFKVPA
jgi:hypothetical protein